MNYSANLKKYLIDIWGKSVSIKLEDYSAIFLGKRLEDLSEKELTTELQFSGYPCICS